MRLATNLRSAAVAAVLVLSVAATASANPVLSEEVTGGALDLAWAPGFGISNSLLPLTLNPGDAGYANPSGDHTVGNAFSSLAPDSGGLCITATDPGGVSDYVWEGWVFLGEGNTRRGLLVRADPNALFSTCYTFVIEAGLLQLNFRKLTGMGSVSLGSWFTTSTPGGFPSLNTWHHMKVMADGGMFRLWWDGFELTGPPIVDHDYSWGWVGVYNFRFDVGFQPFLVDDLHLSSLKPTGVETATWGGLKGLFQ